MLDKNSKIYITPREASQRYRINLSTVYSWCRRRLVETIPPDDHQPGRWLIEEESLRERFAQVYLRR